MISLWQVTRALFEGDSKLLVSQLRALGPQAVDAEGLTVDRAPFFQQLGLAARPLVSRTLRAVGVEHGDEVAVLAMFDKALTPTDLEGGETRLYAAGAIGVVVRMLAARVVVEAPEIRLGASATKKVARVGDSVVVTIPSGTQFAMTVPGVGAVTASTTADVDCEGEITTGSSKVRAED